MAPKVFHVFNFEADFGFHKFKDDSEMETDVTSWFIKQVMMFCQQGMSDCRSRYDTWHKCGGHYVENSAIAIKLTANCTNFACESGMFSLLKSIRVLLR